MKHQLQCEGFDLLPLLQNHCDHILVYLAYDFIAVLRVSSIRYDATRIIFQIENRIANGIGL